MDKLREDPAIPPSGRPVPADYLFLLRPAILVPVWTFYLLGATHAGGASMVPGRILAIGMAAFTAMMGAAYIVNQITDRESDRRNEKLFLLSHGIVSLRAAWSEAALLAAAALTAAVALMPPAFLLPMLAALLLGVLYSVEPFRLKRRPFLDIAANAAGSGIVNTMAGWIAAGGEARVPLLLLPYPFAVAAVHLVTTLADLDGDRETGLRTTGTVLGRKGTMAAAVVSMAAASAAAALTGNRPALFASLFSLPFFFVTAGGGPGARTGRDVLLPAKASTLVFTAAAGYFFPLYLPFAAAVLVMTRFYYSRRFSLEYPSL